MTQPDFSKPHVFAAFPELVTERGAIPALVFQDESGFYPMGDPKWDGDPRSPQPWYWGSTVEQCQATCDRQNAERGFTQEQVDAVIASSLRASLAQR